MFKRKIFILITVIVLFSCKKETKQEKPFNRINISQLLDLKPEPKLLSEFVSDIEYIRPEAKKGSYFQMMGINYVGPEFVILYDKQEQKQLAFKRNGQFIGMLGSRGNGPNEYNGIPDVFVFNDLKEIHLFDKFGRKLLRYNFDLEFINSITLKEVPEAIAIYNNQSYICAYDDEDIRKLDGRDLIIRDPKTFKEINTLLKGIKSKKEKTSQLNYSNSFFFTHKDTLYFTKPSNEEIDIYNICNDKITKTLEINLNQNQNQAVNITPVSIAQFDVMSFSNYLKIIVQKGFTIHTAYYNLATKEISNFNFVNDLDKGINFYPMGNCDGKGYYSDDLKIDQLLDYLKKDGKSKDKIQIKSKFPKKEKWLKETIPNALEDNPWIMVVN